MMCSAEHPEIQELHNLDRSMTRVLQDRYAADTMYLMLYGNDDACARVRYLHLIQAVEGLIIRPYARHGFLDRQLIDVFRQVAIPMNWDVDAWCAELREHVDPVEDPVESERIMRGIMNRWVNDPCTTPVSPIDDKRNLEILMLFVLLAFNDAFYAYWTSGSLEDADGPRILDPAGLHAFLHEDHEECRSFVTMFALMITGSPADAHLTGQLPPFMPLGEDCGGGSSCSDGKSFPPRSYTQRPVSASAPAAAASRAKSTKRTPSWHGTTRIDSISDEDDENSEMDSDEEFDAVYEQETVEFIPTGRRANEHATTDAETSHPRRHRGITPDGKIEPQDERELLNQVATSVKVTFHTMMFHIYTKYQAHVGCIRVVADRIAEQRQEQEQQAQRQKEALVHKMSRAIE